VSATRGVAEEIFPANYWPGEGLGDHLEFALKYDGTNPAILASLFEAIEVEELLLISNPGRRGNLPDACGFSTNFSRVHRFNWTT